MMHGTHNVINTLQYDARYIQRHINTLQYDARYTQRQRCLFSILTSFFAVVYVGALILLITGRIGILGLCSFSCAVSVGVKVCFGLSIFFRFYL
jgi:uncharacterized membrane protein (DUF485 family)